MADGAVIVTGGSRGIGAALSIELNRRGFKVACLSRTGDAPLGCEDPSRFLLCVCDATDEVQLRDSFAWVAEQAGGIKALVNNAGLHTNSKSQELKRSEFERVMEINVTAVMLGCREVFPHFKRQGGGMIFNMGSSFGWIGAPFNLAYCTSKAALGGMTRVLAVEWARYKIRTLNIAPGYIETDLNKDFLESEKVKKLLSERIPTGGPGKAEDVAKLVTALLVEDIPFMTGSTIYLDGGQTFAH